MKKIVLIVVCVALSYALSAQIQHGIKVGLNFAKVGGDIPDGSDISNITGLAVYYVFKTQGDKFSYFFDMGYSQSGFKEKFNGVESSVKIHNMEFDFVGLQYSFMSDWSKIRPVLQTTLGVRGSLSGKITTPEGSESIDLDRQFDMIWSLGGGITLTKHAQFMINYGGGFFDAFTEDSGLKNRQIQLSATYFF